MAAALHHRALTDLALRHGWTAPALPALEEQVATFRYGWETGIFWVAEQNGEIVGICNAILRGDLWFLADFWVDPDYQNQGVGRPVLDHVRQEGVGRGATRFAVWSSIDHPALASYLKAGMLPVSQTIRFRGEPRRSAMESDACFSALSGQVATKLDYQILGIIRPEDHEHWRASGRRGWQLVRNGRPVGYVYVADNGTLGPAVWSDAADADLLLSFAFDHAPEGEITLAVPGINHCAVQACLERGLRIYTTGHLLASAPLGDLVRYVPSGTDLF